MEVRGHGTQQPGQAHQPAHIAPMPVTKGETVDLDPIGLVEDVLQVESDGPSKIKAFGVADTGGRRDAWSRQPHRTGTGACRVRTFRGKLSDQGLDYLDNAINEWLDAHPQVEVKFVTSTVGTFEGKIREPALILNVWY